MSKDSHYTAFELAQGRGDEPTDPQPKLKKRHWTKDRRRSHREAREAKAWRPSD